MEYVSLGKTGLRVSRICLGCMSYGDPKKWVHPWVLDEAGSRLGRAGFAVEETKVRANKGRGGRHVIWAATNTVGGIGQAAFKKR